MYRVVRRTGDIFGDEPHVCEFVCDTSDDVATLPTSIAEGTGGKSKYDNQKCSAGSTACIATNSGSNSYILNNSNVWIAQSSGSSGSGGSSGEDVELKIYPLDMNGMPTGNVIISEGITGLGLNDNSHTNYGPFNNNYNVTSVTFPKSMEKINKYSFNKATNLKTVIFPAECKIATISDYAFEKSGIENITIPGSITTIGLYAFASMKNLKTVNLGTANVRLRSYAFQGSSLEHINFGSGNVELESNVFKECNSLISVYIPANVTLTSETENVFYDCTKLETVIFDDKHTFDKITKNFVRNCYALKTFVFPPLATSIGNNAFMYAGLETINIPDSVTRIDASAFSYMPNLISVTLPSTITYTSYYPGKTMDTFYMSKGITTVNLGEGFKANLSLANQVALTQETVSDIASKLYDYTGDANTHKICFNAAVYDAIPEDVMAVFTAKKWTVERSTSS